MIRKILKISSIFLALLILICGVIYFEDHRFWNRYVLSMANKGIVPPSGWAGSEYPVTGSNHEDEHQLLQIATPNELTIPKETLDAVTQYAAERNSTSLLIWHKGHLQLREHFQGYNSDKEIVGKSMAKMVVGIMIGRAIKDGFITGLDEPAATYINEWQGTEKDTITIRNLLHMAAGFEKFYTLDFNPFGNFSRSYLSGYHEKVMINNYQLINTPGTKYDYSQVSSDLLGLILERATEMPYGKYLSEALIQPIGAQGGQVMMNRPDGLAHTGCCLLLPSESWLRIGIFLMNSGVIGGQSLFPDNWMKEYLAPSDTNPALGLHIWLAEPYFKKRSFTEVGDVSDMDIFGVLHSEPYLAKDLFLFDGNGHQVVYIVPSEELVILRTGSYSRDKDFVWDNSVLPNTIIRALRQP